MKSINIADIRVNGGTQSRAQINRDVVSDYAEAVDGGAEFPPIVLYHDGSNYWLADGFHRYEAYATAKVYEVPADVRQGTQRDAILHSVGANAHHGLRRTNDDKRRAVMVLLNDQEWSQWSNREIARQCGVHYNFVGKLRSDVTITPSDSEGSRTYTTKHGTQATMNTANIGGESKPGQETPPAQGQENKAETSDTTDNAPDQSKLDQEPDPNAKARKELAKLTREALEDDLIGLRQALKEAKAKASDQKAEIEKLKEQLRGHTGDKDETIRRLTKTIEHKSSEVFRANEKFAEEKRKNYALSKRVKELEAMEIKL